MSIVIEEVRVFADFHTSEWVFSIHHFQLDNMQDVAKFPVILSPIDSGHNRYSQHCYCHSTGLSYSPAHFILSCVLYFVVT